MITTTIYHGIMIILIVIVTMTQGPIYHHYHHHYHLNNNDHDHHSFGLGGPYGWIQAGNDAMCIKRLEQYLGPSLFGDKNKGTGGMVGVLDDEKNKENKKGK